MRNRIRAALVAALTLITSQLAVAPVGAVVAQKVVIIVGPTGAQTDDYRSRGDEIAAGATALGANVVKVYSPNATWAAVKAAVNGANIVLYLGHGNGYPNPYSSGAEPTDRDNGWGLNRTTTGGDSDDWSAKMVYCGEKALLGTVTSASAAQWSYCGGSTNTDGITPAPNWVMIYSNACYAPGASEGWDVPATEPVAMQRVRNYSYPSLLLGGGAYFATDMGAQGIVEDILQNPNMAFGAIAEQANGYDLSRQRHFAHPDLAGKRIWIQNSGISTSGQYKLAYAGNPALTPAGATVAYTEPVPPPSGTTSSTTFDPQVRAIFLKGSHTGYQFTDGVLVAQKSFTLANNSAAYTSARAVLVNQYGYWLYITSGVWAGYWVRQSSVTYLEGSPVSPAPGTDGTYSPARKLVFMKGTHTGYQFSATGALTAVKSFSLAGSSTAYAGSRGTIANQTGSWFYVTTGVWAGYWMRNTDVVYLAPS